jgi:hypothetical protein
MIKTLSPGLIFFLNYLALKHHFKKTPNWSIIATVTGSIFMYTVTNDPI